MNYREEDIEELIGKFVVGEASEAEIRELREWCALSPENQKYLDDAFLIFEKAQLPVQTEFDPDLAWEKVKAKISGADRKTRFFMPIWGIAAGLILIFAFSFLFYQYALAPRELVLVANNQVFTQALPDQTEISLNQHSEAQVEYNERKKTGIIRLSGEALVDIPETKKVNWVVETGNLRIEDIGTVFHVKAYPDSETVEVSVQEGEVRLYTESQSGITLQAGEKGIYFKSQQTFSKAEADTNVAAFKTRQFFFEEKELRQVVAELSAVYGKEIVLDENLAACKLTVSFDNEDLETILAVISETLTLKVSTAGDQIRISGEGCF